MYTTVLWPYDVRLYNLAGSIGIEQNVNCKVFAKFNAYPFLVFFLAQITYHYNIV